MQTSNYIKQALFYQPSHATYQYFESKSEALFQRPGKKSFIEVHHQQPGQQKLPSPAPVLDSKQDSDYVDPPPTYNKSPILLRQDILDPKDVQQIETVSALMVALIIWANAHWDKGNKASFPHMNVHTALDMLSSISETAAAHGQFGELQFATASARTQSSLDLYVRSCTDLASLNPFEIHALILDSTLADWRSYIIALTERITYQSDKVLVASIDGKDPAQLLDVEERQYLKELEDQILDVILVLGSTCDAILSLIENYRRFRQDPCVWEEPDDGDYDAIDIAFQEKLRDVSSNREKARTLHAKLKSNSQKKAVKKISPHATLQKKARRMVRQSSGHGYAVKAHGNDDVDREVTTLISNEMQNSSSEDTAIKTAAFCGNGAYSNVYCVKMDPNHHRLSTDLGASFALKEFRDKQKSAKDFVRELDILKELRRYSHAHIVTRLASWTQEERYYMLFPYAQCNLREYMGRNKFNKEDALWLLDQFHGMAEAVKWIHDLSGPETPTSSLTLMTPAAGERRTAWHHDLKPENILFFKNKTFSNQRDDKRDADSGTSSMKDDAFWQKVGNDYVLRKDVVTQLERLEEALIHPSAPPFKEILGYIRRMLETRTHERIKALELCDLLGRTRLSRKIEVESPVDDSEPVTRLSLIPTDHHSPDVMSHGNSPSGQSSGPAYAEHLALSPSDMSLRARRHSRNSSASELMPSNATRSRQSSNASNHSNLSIRERKSSHSNADSPRVTEGGT
ncbi:MAG: hypothetical protein ASARMPRED_008012 [Alectoria sarmentosa]|nr:MAG: hypothetical protein ASARMPRED_008012 [Alectoria sarmentosa]